MASVYPVEHVNSLWGGLFCHRPLKKLILIRKRFEVLFYLFVVFEPRVFLVGVIGYTIVSYLISPCVIALQPLELEEITADISNRWPLQLLGQLTHHGARYIFSAILLFARRTLEYLRFLLQGDILWCEIVSDPVRLSVKNLSVSNKWLRLVELEIIEVVFLPKNRVLLLSGVVVDSPRWKVR